ncbi:MAG: ribonuclease HII [Candidatus Eisenbacteria bacterium]
MTRPPEHGISARLLGRLLEAIEGETAVLYASRNFRRRSPEPVLEEALGWRRGGGGVVGVDEAGRGPLAGPVVAAAVRFAPGRVTAGLDDSKRLTPEGRSALFPRILREADGVGLGLVTAGGVDRWNVREAARRAMIRAVRDSGPAPRWVLVDGTLFESFPWPQAAVIGGDRRSPSIAAASVVAKVVRDRLMECYHRILPVYRFDRHKGYPTQEHASAIREYGPSSIHRRTFHVPALVLTLPLEESGP